MYACVSRANLIFTYAVSFSLAIHGAFLLLPVTSTPATASAEAHPATVILNVALRPIPDSLDLPDSPSLPANRAPNKTLEDLEAETTAVKDQSQRGSAKELAGNTVDSNATGMVAAYLPDHEYFTLPELEEPPHILSEIDTNPFELQPYKEGGSVVLRLWINERGVVEELKLVESVLPEPFINNAIKNFREARFMAGIKGGLAVKSVVTVVVNYEPSAS